MSLTSVLKSNPELCRRLGELLPASTLPNTQSLTMRAPPQSARYSLIGTAFDYLFRFEIGRRNPSVHRRDWVANRGVALAHLDASDGGKLALRWPAGVDPDSLLALADRSLEEAKTAEGHYATLLEPTSADVSTIARHSLNLATLDVIYRAGIIDPSLGFADPADLDDLVRLWEVIPFDNGMGVCLAENVWLNPTFGRFSIGIGGADADVVADTLLIDIKTTKNPQIRPHIPQLLGYAMLAGAYQSQESPEFPIIESIGVYFARQGTLVAIPLGEVRKNSHYPTVLEELLTHCDESPLTLRDVRLESAGDPGPRKAPAHRRETPRDQSRTKPHK